MPTVDWVLLGSGESNKRWDLWQPLPAARLQTHFASWQQKHLIIIIIMMLIMIITIIVTAQCGQAAARQMVAQNKITPGRGGAIINM